MGTETAADGHHGTGTQPRASGGGREECGAARDVVAKTAQNVRRMEKITNTNWGPSGERERLLRIERERKRERGTGRGGGERAAKEERTRAMEGSGESEPGASPSPPQPASARATGERAHCCLTRSSVNPLPC